MTASSEIYLADLEYPESDGLPMAESDPTRDYLIYAVETLSIYFQNNNNIYVSGNSFIYYEEGNPKAVVSPDVFVVFGVVRKKRRSYKVWQENHKFPNFVLEITSKSTANEDRVTKKNLYAVLGIEEYFLYDPTEDYLKPPLQGFHLVEGNYLPLSSTTNIDRSLSIFSQVLGLELRSKDCEMRFYVPETGKKLLSHQETEQARIEAEQARLHEQEKVQKLAAKLRELGIDPDSL